MITRTLGNTTVSALGLGAMPLSRPDRDGTLPDRDRAIATVHAALDRGVTIVDCADCYGPDDYPDDEGLGHNEVVVAAALRGRSEQVLVATKGGIRRRGADWPIDGSPTWIREAVHGSLRRLGVVSIDLYQHHRPDPEVPYVETMGAFKELYDAGLVRQVGISNARARCQPAAGLPGLAAREGRPRDPDPRGQPAGVRGRLGGRGRAHPQ